MRFLPKSKKLHISAPARNDLRLIGEYTQREWGLNQKKKYLGQIKNSFKAICETPGLGKLRDDIDKGLSSYSVQKHIVFYREIKSELLVIRVLHERMDSDRHLS